MEGLASGRFPSATILDLFAGPGGWDQGAKLAGINPSLIHGVELDAHAVETARAAGFNRTKANVLDLDPSDFSHITGMIASPPCPTFSPAGNRSGLGDDYQRVLDAITHLGMENGCECSWEDLLGEAEAKVADPRTPLILQVVRFMFALPKLEWVILEQVPSLEFMWEDIAFELLSAGWTSADVAVVDAMDFGLSVRRKRVFLLAHKHEYVGISLGLDKTGFPSMAESLGWEAGDQVRTRGNRKAGGGNLFSADGPSWCLTGSSRSWIRESNGEQITIAEASVLNGFPPNFPWQGSRSKQFLQVGNVVIPAVASVLLREVVPAAKVSSTRQHLI